MRDALARVRWAAIALVLLTGSSVRSAQAGPFRLDFVLASPVSDATEDKFGQAVAAAGRNILVGDPGDYTWVAALYDGTTGDLLRVLHSPLPSQEQFGRLVAAAGDRLVVSQSFIAVHLFDAEGTFLRTLVPEDEAGSYGFGFSLAALNDRVLVGAPYAHPGAAYLFDAATGAQLARFTAPGGFGAAVAIAGDTLFIGAPRDTPGAVYAFDATTGALMWVRRAPAPAAEGSFGAALAALDDAVVVGAPDRGVAYLLDARTGARRQTYRRPSGRHVPGFGRTLAASGNRVLIGGDVFAARTGRLIASVRANAWSVALVGRRIVAGGVADHETHYDHGAVRVFTR